jgi:hypothetical protein
MVQGIGREDARPHREMRGSDEGVTAIMEDAGRTLVILLTMHRCGSSLTTRVLQRLGMSLGPFELYGGLPSNPHGHFESVPFVKLNRQVQKLAFGFCDDLPESPETLAHFLETKGDWDEGTLIPDELFAEARSLIRALVDSGQVSGFKDPRTILTWPFWKRVLESFPGLRVVPVALLRSPHEIAMSLVTRRHGWCGYWTSLDIVAVHLERQKAILAGWEQHPPCLCFGSPEYPKTLEAVAQQCGLSWNAIAASKVFDPSCVHQMPASVPHEAQDLFESLCESAAPVRDPEKNRAQLEKDARHLENNRLEQWQEATQQISDGREQNRLADLRLVEAQRQTGDAEARLAEVQALVLDIRARVLDLQAQLISEQRMTNEIQAQLIRTQEREIAVLQHNEQLRQHIDQLGMHFQRMESHPLLGPALRTRRRMRRIIHSIRARSTSGHTVHRIDSGD